MQTFWNAKGKETKKKTFLDLLPRVIKKLKEFHQAHLIARKWD